MAKPWTAIVTMGEDQTMGEYAIDAEGLGKAFGSQVALRWFRLALGVANRTMEFECQP